METSPIAFIGAVEMAIPHFTGDKGICRQVEDLIGDVAGSDSDRWHDFLQAGSRTSVEFATSWGKLHEEATHFATLLGKELQSPLSMPVTQAGGSNLRGETRKAVVEQREGLVHEVLVKILSEHPDRQARPVTVFGNFDKLSGAWLLSLPGPVTGLSSQVFAESLAAHLCLASPAVLASRQVGQNIGRRGAVIDPYGDAIMNCRDLQHKVSTGLRIDNVKSHPRLQGIWFVCRPPPCSRTGRR